MMRRCTSLGNNNKSKRVDEDGGREMLNRDLIPFWECHDPIWSNDVPRQLDQGPRSVPAFPLLPCARVPLTQINTVLIPSSTLPITASQTETLATGRDRPGLLRLSRQYAPPDAPCPQSLACAVHRLFILSNLQSSR